MTLEMTRQHELTWQLACSQRILGSIQAAQGKQEEADTYFEQAMRVFRRCGMSLEYARTLRSYSDVLLQRSVPGDKASAQGLNYLQEAQRIFKECGAMVDLSMTERLLAKHAPRKKGVGVYP